MGKDKYRDFHYDFLEKYVQGRYQSFDGFRVRYAFDNGYGASVVCHSGSYGGPEGLFEIAVLDNKTGKLLYDTPITGDVLGYCTQKEVENTLINILGLYPKNGEKPAIVETYKKGGFEFL